MNKHSYKNETEKHELEKNNIEKNSIEKYDVVVIGGGPAGLASAIAAKESGASVLLIEREGALGGILKQCIHDGFGLTRYGEKLSGPEYAGRDIKSFTELGIEKRLETFVTKLERINSKLEFLLTVTSRNGIEKIGAKSIVLACGCRERTARQVFIHGTRPAGIYTAGNAQNFVNLQGQMPTKKCVILGSGDIGLIMARRLTLEGAEVLGVYEVKSTPSGLKRNIAQCLEDYNIPLHLSTTVTRVFGDKRLEAVEVAKVDEKLQPIPGTEEIIECDGLIISVGLIPENEIAEKLGVELDVKTKGAFVDNKLQSLVDGVFVAGNCLSVNDLVDYVSENGTIAGTAAAEYALRDGDANTKGEAAKVRKLVPVDADKKFLYCVPQYIDVNSLSEAKASCKLESAENISMQNAVFYLRSRTDCDNQCVTISVDGKEIVNKKIKHVRSAEAIRIQIAAEKFVDAGLNEDSTIVVRMS